MSYPLRTLMLLLISWLVPVPEAVSVSAIEKKTRQYSRYFYSYLHLRIGYDWFAYSQSEKILPFCIYILRWEISRMKFGWLLTSYTFFLWCLLCKKFLHTIRDYSNKNNYGNWERCIKCSLQPGIEKDRTTGDKLMSLPIMINIITL